MDLDLTVMTNLKAHIRDVADFPATGILFRDVAPLFRLHFAETLAALDAAVPDSLWQDIDAVAGIESRGFVLASALAARRSKGFVAVRKQGKLPPPVLARSYRLEYGSGILEMQPGTGLVLLVDDVLATGGTLSGAAELCAEAGYGVGGLLVLVDLKLADEFVWRGMPAWSVVTYGQE